MTLHGENYLNSEGCRIEKPIRLIELDEATVASYGKAKRDKGIAGVARVAEVFP